MRRAARKHLTALATWFTAAATLFASSPRFECVCPDGSRTPFCLSTISDRLPCCGEDSASETSTADESECPCCCKKQDRSKDPPDSSPRPTSVRETAAPSGPGFERRRCEKSPAVVPSFVRGDSAPPQDPVVIAWIDGDFAADAAAPLSNAASIPFASSLPPPPDLVVTLCHFVI